MCTNADYLDNHFLGPRNEPLLMRLLSCPLLLGYKILIVPPICLPTLFVNGPYWDSRSMRIMVLLFMFRFMNVYLRNDIKKLYKNLLKNVGDKK